MNYIINPVERAEANRLRIFEFFKINPCHTNKDASASLDLSEVTVGKHARAIRAGWRPKEELVDCDQCGPVSAKDQANCPMKGCGVAING